MRMIGLGGRELSETSTQHRSGKGCPEKEDSKDQESSTVSNVVSFLLLQFLKAVSDSHGHDLLTTVF